MGLVVGLTAPWYTLVNEIKYTYGRSPFINVGQLVEDTEEPGIYNLAINVTKDCVADALRQVIPVQFEFGDILVNIIIYNSEGEVVEVNNMAYTRETLAKVFTRALKMNPLFKGIVLRPEGIPTTIPDVTVIIAKEIVQFYNDDISDLCGNYNEIAAEVFAEVSNSDFATELVAGFTTYDPKCKLQKDIYCPVKKGSHKH